MSITFSYKDQIQDSTYWVVYHYDSTLDTYTEITDSTSMDYFSDTAVAGDAIMFRFSMARKRPPGKMNFNVGTAMVGTNIVLKHYRSDRHGASANRWSEDVDWTDITSDIVDDTNSFTTLGANSITLPSAEGWLNDRFSPITTSNYYLWYKIEIDSLTSITEGGANTTDKLNFPYRHCLVQNAYHQGTLTNDSGSYYMRDDDNTFDSEELSMRAVFFPGLPKTSNKYPIQYANGTSIYLGTSYTYSPGYERYYFDTDYDYPVAGDTYTISYIMRDLYEACLADGKDWITAHNYMARRNDWQSYTFDCSVDLESTTDDDWMMLSGLDQNYFFTHNHTLWYDFSRIANTQMMFGLRAMHLKDGSNSFSESITGMGCTFHFHNDWNNHNLYFTGDWAGCNIFAGLKYNYTTYVSFSIANVYDCRIGCAQMSGFYETDGLSVVHCPASEPMRNPSDSFRVVGFASSSACIYITGNYSRRVVGLDSSNSVPFSCYGSSFSEANGTIVQIVDRTDTTRDRYSFGATAVPSGHWNMIFTSNYKLQKEDGSPIEGATITMTNNLDEVEFTGTTDADGELNDQEALVKDVNLIYVDEVKTENTVEYNPFTLTITADGYETYTDTLTLEKKEDLIINLKESFDTVTTNKGVGIKVNKENVGNDRDVIILP